MKRILSLALAASFLLSGCSYISRDDIARSIAAPRLPINAVQRAGDFALQSYSRIDQKGAAAQVYIEGDGDAPDPQHNDPSPVDPLALRMAVKDEAPNVIWLARPCQYRLVKDCPMSYLGDRAFAPEVVAAYNAVLDEMKTKYSLQGYVLNGYRGGGTIAVLAAEGRGDVLGVRTVSSLLSHDLKHSLDPSDWAAKAEKIPQRHFSGTAEPMDNFGTYQAGVGDDICLHHAYISLEGDWTKDWPQQLALPLTCAP